MLYSFFESKEKKAGIMFEENRAKLLCFKFFGELKIKQKKMRPEETGRRC